MASASTFGCAASNAARVASCTISFGMDGPNIFLIGNLALPLRTKALLPREPTRNALSNRCHRPRVWRGRRNRTALG